MELEDLQEALTWERVHSMRAQEAPKRVSASVFAASTVSAQAVGRAVPEKVRLF